MQKQIDFYYENVGCKTVARMLKPYIYSKFPAVTLTKFTSNSYLLQRRAKYNPRTEFHQPQKYKRYNRYDGKKGNFQQNYHNRPLHQNSSSSSSYLHNKAIKKFHHEQRNFPAFRYYDQEGNNQPPKFYKKQSITEQYAEPFPLDKSSSYHQNTLWNTDTSSAEQKKLNQQHQFVDTSWANTMDRQTSEPLLHSQYHQQNKRNSNYLDSFAGVSKQTAARQNLEENTKNMAIQMIQIEGQVADNSTPLDSKEAFAPNQEKQYQSQNFNQSVKSQDFQPSQQTRRVVRTFKSKWDQMEQLPQSLTLQQSLSQYKDPIKQQFQQQNKQLEPEAIIDFEQQNRNPHNDPLIEQILSLQLEPPQFISYQSFSPVHQHFSSSKRNFQLLTKDWRNNQQDKMKHQQFSPDPSYSQLNQKSYFSDINFIQRQQSYSGQMHQYQENQQIQAISILKQIKFPKSEVIFKLLEKNNNSSVARMMRLDMGEIGRVSHQFRELIEKEQEELHKDRKSLEINAARRIIEPLYSNRSIEIIDGRSQLNDIPSLSVLPNICKKFDQDQVVKQLNKDKIRLAKDLEQLEIKQLTMELDLMKLENNHDYEKKLDEIRLQLGEEF